MEAKLKVVENPIANFVRQVTERGYKGLTLLLRIGSGEEVIGQFAINQPQAMPDALYQLAQENASGSRDSVACFVLRAEGADGGAPTLSRSFSIARTDAPVSSGDRYDVNNLAVARLVLEHLDHSNKVISNVVPAAMREMAAALGAASEPLAEIARTNIEAQRVLRADRALEFDHAKWMAERSERYERTDQIVQMLAPIAMTVMQKINSHIEGPGQGAAAAPVAQLPAEAGAAPANPVDEQLARLERLERMMEKLVEVVASTNAKKRRKRRTTEPTP